MTSDLAAIAARIEANPLGRLMYGQRELFHSNLLAWFFDVLPDAADGVFLGYSNNGSGGRRHVERERQSLDLVMHWPDRSPVVIENKVFSLPRADQLDEYAQIVRSWKDGDVGLVLLSVSRPHFTDTAWVHLSYAELSERILANLPAVDSYEVETMRRYASLATDLHELLSTIDVRSDDEPVWHPDEYFAPISNPQLRAALRKARAQRVALIINEAIPDLEQPAGGGFSNSVPLVEALEYVYTGGHHVHLGWQLQGDQFRRAVSYHDETIKGRTQSSRLAREAVSRERPDFFVLPAAVAQEFGGRKDFNHFAPGFVYRYVKARGITIAELKEAAREVHAQIVSLGQDGHQARPDNAVRSAP